jgi:2'-5' RNA ligase
MINLQLLLEGRYDYGCVMGRLDEETSHKILEFNNRLIGEDVLYTEEENHGREVTSHVTIKFGLTESYSQEQMREILREIRSFMLEVRGTSLFENKSHDVVKFDVEGKELRALNEIFCKLPNEDSHPEYNPHMTLAYVRKGMGKNFVRESQRFARVLVNMIEYSDRGVKSYYNL